MADFNGLLDEEGKPKYVGQSPESSSKATNKPGLYIHKETGTHQITAPGSRGVTQADAFVRLGYEWAGPVPTPNEIRDMQKKQLEADKAAEATAPTADTAASDKKVAKLQEQLKEERAARKEAEKTATDAQKAADEATQKADEAAKELAEANTNSTTTTPPSDGGAGSTEGDNK